jgi:hypothetical protein
MQRWAVGADHHLVDGPLEQIIILEVVVLGHGQDDACHVQQHVVIRHASKVVVLGHGEDDACHVQQHMVVLKDRSLDGFL